MNAPRLGINIDHIATLRQLRQTPYPDILEAARLAEIGGAEQITVHLREDRRHIQDEDVKKLRSKLKVMLNLEMAATDSMVKFAKKIGPDWVCIVPEKRQEVTTEGGLNLKKVRSKLAQFIQSLKKSKIKVSLFVEPTLSAVTLSKELGADAIELHTGCYCIATQKKGGFLLSPAAKNELKRIYEASLFAKKQGIHPHAGHGIDYQNVRPLVELMGPDQKFLIEEYNIGHSIVCRAALVGFEQATREMFAAIVAP